MSRMTLVPAGEVWLTSSLIDHDPAPEIPDEFRAELSLTLSPHERPDFPLNDDADDATVERALRFDEWTQAVWEPWSSRWQVIEASRAFYKRLYSSRSKSTMDSDSLELVWGFGRLRWANPAASIDHPLITVPVEIHLDEESRLTVGPAGPAVIENGYLSEIALADLGTFTALRGDGAADDLDLWSDSRPELLLRLLRSIDHDGVMEQTPSAPGSSAKLADEWVLSLRRRHADYLGFVEDLRRLYEGGITPPLPFLSLAVDEPSLLAPSLGIPGLEGEGG